MAMAADTRANTTGHWTIFHVHANAPPRWSHPAAFSASVGPTRTSAVDTTMKIASATVRPRAVSFTLHNGRLSWMSYAWFSVSMMALTPEEVLEMVPIIPRVSRP